MVIHKKRIFSAVLAFYPLLSMYGVGSINFGDIFLIVALLIGKAPNENRLQGSHVPVQMLCFYMLWCFIGIVLNMFRMDFLLGAVVKRVIKFGIYLITITASIKLLDRRQFVGYYRYLVYLTFAGLVVQYLAYYLMGRIVVIKIPFLPYSGVVSEESINMHLSYQFRPGSLYPEPAACCYSLLPFLAYSMFAGEGNRTRKRDIAISGISILMTVSSAGVICSLLILGFYFTNLIITKSVSLQRKVLLLTGSCVLLAIFAWIYTKTPLYYAIERMQRTSDNTALADAVWGKTSAGSELLNRLTEVTSWYGMGFGNLNMETLADYTNSINYILYCTGYIGMAILTLWVLSVFVNSRNAGKATILVFCACCVSSRIFISYFIMIYMIFCLIDDKRMGVAESDETEQLQQGKTVYG